MIVSVFLVHSFGVLLCVSLCMTSPIILLPVIWLCTVVAKGLVVGQNDFFFFFCKCSHQINSFGWLNFTFLFRDMGVIPDVPQADNVRLYSVT